MNRELVLLTKAVPVLTPDQSGAVTVHVMLRGAARRLVWLLGILHLVRYDVKASTVWTVKATTSGTS